MQDCTTQCSFALHFAKLYVQTVLCGSACSLCLKSYQLCSIQLGIAQPAAVATVCGKKCSMTSMLHSIRLATYTHKSACGVCTANSAAHSAHFATVPATECNKLTNSLPTAGGVQAAEATTLKALMQLHAPSPVKQRAGRDKRAIRTMLQDSREMLLQSIAVSAQTGLQNITGHLGALHCIVAVQESVPAPAPVLSAADAPPGFAPKASTEPSAPSPFALKLWPFGDDAQQHPQPRGWPVEDAAPLLQLLRVHKVLASKSKQQIPQQLLADILLSASAAATHSPSLSQRLVQEVKNISSDQPSPTLSAQLHLLELQQLHNRGESSSSSAVEQLWSHVETTMPDALTAGSRSAQEVAEAMLQLAKWSQASNGTMTSTRQAEMLSRLREVALGSSEASEPCLPLNASPPALCLAAAVKLAPASATAWLAYADYLHSLCSLHPSSTLLQSSIPASSQGCAETAHNSQPGSDESDMLDPQSNWQILTQMVKAYCTHLKLAAQYVGLTGLPEDHMSVLLKLLQLLNMEELAPECLQAIRAGVESIPVLTWRCVVPQLFALLAHQDAGVWQLAQQLLQALELQDPAAVLYPALVESRRSNSGKWMDTSSWHCCLFHSLYNPTAVL